MSNCAPQPNKEQNPEHWYSKGTVPWPKLGNEKPKGETVAYERLPDAWKQGQAR